ncbi:hypothetical protein [Paraburkholderia domus]|uniref:hypothetical protein n=1 Tax=Paraburkholderia domus TaxID=2793075 RepID=UPI0019126EF8|nr:hypothetical protein [Paraburkholderia domus]MBK5169372.1 hypothetical protein [Burkholderia sp. R-70211]
MSNRDLQPLLHRLRGYCALAEATGRREMRAQRDIEVKHWSMKQLAPGEGDLLTIMRRCELDFDATRNRLFGAIDRLPHELRAGPLPHQLRRTVRASTAALVARRH